jgi:CBS domain-containing protein
MTLRDVMTTSVIFVKPETPLKEVARQLVEHGISGVPVVDTSGRVVGVVSEADFVVKETGTAALPHRPLERLFGESKLTRSYRAKLAATTAAEAMTAPAITISVRRSVGEAARLMTSRRINRLVVVDEEGRLVGIVSRADLVRAYVRSDEELMETIRTEVLWRILWLDPNAFSVHVEDGVANVRGHVDRRSMAETVESSVAMVPGIVDVRADITWSLDDRQIKPTTVAPFFPVSPR